MPARPRFKTHVRPLRRGPGAVQFGMAPEFGVVLEGLMPAEVALIEGLDGSRDLLGVRAAAALGGVAAHRVDELLGTLRAHRLLVEQPTDRASLSRLGVGAPGSASLRTADLLPDADALAVSGEGAGDGYAQLAARTSYRVVVEGRGRLPDAVAAVLSSTGVGVQRAGAHPHGSSPDATDPDLVVLVAAGAVAADAGRRWLERGVAHLPVLSLGHRVVVGPLVAPDGGPCLRCLDLHRTDRDPAWPTLLAQLSASDRRSAPVSAETAVTAVAAGLVAMLVHAAVEGRGLPPGASLEVALPWPRVDHRRWTAHPRCSCTGAAAGSGDLLTR